MENKEQATAALNRMASEGFDGQYHKAWAAYVDDIESKNPTIFT